MAFDFGMRHIGVAVGQFITHTANPLATLSAINGKPDWDRLGNLIETWQPERLIVGLPLNMDHTEGEMCESARRFAKKLEHRYSLTVHMVDERLTTFEAQRSDPEGTHEIAAKLIAETYLNS
ncbi:MAG: Holliday junction resolvase RuvX [Gammaproteobacteria bacterium]|nr:Holliday junction resolvase RuvX [Pseudomonadota bacterium]TDJ35056.1 MAG: Holliday junction resolvase RuvX [Gammaproteobacteria bacterium]